jgi:hypothetical protein
MEGMEGDLRQKIQSFNLYNFEICETCLCVKKEEVSELLPSEPA